MILRFVNQSMSNTLVKNEFIKTTVDMFGSHMNQARAGGTLVVFLKQSLIVKIVCILTF